MGQGCRGEAGMVPLLVGLMSEPGGHLPGPIVHAHVREARGVSDVRIARLKVWTDVSVWGVRAVCASTIEQSEDAHSRKTRHGEY
jgi:hypothetical protein